MKKPSVMRFESVLVYCVGRSDLRHRCQYLPCCSRLSLGSAISQVEKLVIVKPQKNLDDGGFVPVPDCQTVDDPPERNNMPTLN